MKRLTLIGTFCLMWCGASIWLAPRPELLAETPKAAAPAPSEDQLGHARRTVKMLDEIYKTIIVLVTEKYVNNEEDFAAGSAAVLLFEKMSAGDSHRVRLIDATGDPYEEKNVARDDFEKTGLKALKQGAAEYEKIEDENGKPVLRVLTAVPVVHQKCVICHAHYKDAKPGEPIGALSYTIPIR